MAVQKMQDYIKLHIDDMDFCIDDVCNAVGYSRRNADRLFKTLLGKTLQEYIKAISISASALQLLDTKDNILDVALQNHFQSHEGFTRSFKKYFCISPSDYRRNPIPLPLFIQYPISHYYAMLDYKEDITMSQELNFCMITAMERPKRKLIFLPSHHAKDYFSYCEEMGCEWEGLLNSIPNKIDTAALIELPTSLVKEGYSNIAAGIEVPYDYDTTLHDGYEVAPLQECVMLYFQSEPYENENDFCLAIENTYKAIGKYVPEQFGYTFAYDIAPTFNFGADKKNGAKLAIPVLKMT